MLQKNDVDSAVAAALARLKVQRVRGSKWAIGGGCGVTVEGESDDVGIACPRALAPVPLLVHQGGLMEG